LYISRRQLIILFPANQQLDVCNNELDLINEEMVGHTDGGGGDVNNSNIQMNTPINSDRF
jgi:hypothetical protein